jgi:uncharacterized protein YcbX
VTASVSGLSLTPVKGTRLQTTTTLTLGCGGADGDRRFYVIDERDRMLNGKQLGDLQQVISELTEDGGLRLTFPGGESVEAATDDGESVQTRFYSRSREDVLVAGPFSAALSDFLGRPIRLVRATGRGRAVDRGIRGAVSLISRASLEELAARAEVDEVDARRFRMLIEVAGIPAHTEDRWVGERVQVGETVIRLHGHVGRCLITSRDPESGTVDLPTLDILGSYREGLQTTEPLPFGVYGEVIEPGVVAVGDPVALRAG